MSIEDGLTYRHKAYANCMKAYRQSNPDWKERQRESEEYAKKWMETSARAYQIAQEKLIKMKLEAL
jgi:hypothetical protein